MPGLFDIREFKTGQDVRFIRDQLNALRRAVMALKPCDSADIKAKCTERGTTYRIARKLAAGSESCPFDISIDSDEDGILTATFRAGTINQLLPDNYLEGIEVPDDATKYLVLSCTATNGEITAATFSAEDDPPDALAPMAGEPPTAFDLLIGVSVDGSPVKVWGCGNIQALPVEAFRLQKAVPVAGQVPYDVYYTWEFSLI